MLTEHSDVIPIPPLTYPPLPRSNSDGNRKYGLQKRQHVVSAVPLTPAAFAKLAT
jgi:hypothetical protein